jgi:conjugal transfer/type IV secretion protein DotA/TraY
MISNGNNKVKYPPPTATGAPTGGSLTSACLNKITVAKSNMTSYLALSDPSGGGEGNNQGSLSLPSVETDENVAQFLDAITGPLRGAVPDFMLHLTTKDPRGPVASLAGIGEDLLAVAENIWFGMMIASLVAMLIACIMSGMQPACMAVGSIITVLVPILMAVIMILWVAGGMIGIYLPLVPYLVFTFTALGWVLLVIETIVAAPIVALGLVSPSGEHLGKAAPAVQLVANVFLRPSLMVIGFATAAKLAEAMIGMLNYGFFATVDASVHGIGVF